MENLEKLFDVFASGLFIKHAPAAKEEEDGEETRSSTEPASDEVRETFRNLMSEHLYKKLDRCHVGGSITYDYYLGKIRGSKLGHADSVVLTINSNLQDIIDELPELPDGDEYAFPAATAVSVRVIGFDEDGILTELHKCSQWITNALAT